LAISLKNKTVLITAGPTWIKIDSVRIISNFASGETGSLLAKKLKKLGAKVTLVLGPGQEKFTAKGVRVIRFRFFEELERILKRELSSRKYELAVHSAAVSDYRIGSKLPGKISSGIGKLSLKLVPTPKLVDLFKRLSQKTFLVAFKFEPDCPGSTLIKEARALINNSRARVVVANTCSERGYAAYLVTINRVSKRFNSKVSLVNNLIKLIQLLRAD
jgi:phosphopantothenoylcysteine decarboxylase/phosphopantothenate--cysteine ligase